MTFGQQMRTLRALRGFSQQELADKVGISRVYITAIEIGTVNATSSVEGRIREALAWPAEADKAFEILSPADAFEQAFVKDASHA